MERRYLLKSHQLQLNIEELGFTRVWTEEERQLQQKTATELNTATEMNHDLTEKYDQEIKTRMCTSKELETTQPNLQEELFLRKETESNLSEASEINRVLEDKYELEQNTMQRTVRKLQNTQSALYNSHKSLTSTLQSLEQVKCELQNTQVELVAISDSLSELEDRRSFRKLGRNMWQSSKTHVRQRFSKVGERLRRSSKSDEDNTENESDSKFQYERRTTPDHFINVVTDKVCTCITFIFILNLKSLFLAPISN